MSVLFHMLPIFGCLLAIGIVEYLSARLRRWANDEPAPKERP
jgi:hypothetical protein